MERPVRRVLLVALVLASAPLLAPVASAQPPGGRGRGMGMGGMMSHAALLRQEAVQADLGLSADQKSKVASELPQRGPGGGGGGGGGNPRDMTDEERQKWMEERRARQAEDDKKVAGLLDAKQLGRLKEIRIQALGAGALMDETVAKELGVTDDQVSKLQAAMQSMRGQGGGDPAEMRRTMYTKALEMLSPEQKTKLEALRGAPFDTSKLQMRGPGGGGRAL
ncbi:MAG: hypothetical protein ACKO5R_12690 [Planctomycetaceae bacterium]